MGMTTSNMVMYEEEFQELNKVIQRLLVEANAKVIFLVDKNGQLISGVGETAVLIRHRLLRLQLAILQLQVVWPS
jgi:hypothetical protein